jgi:hypothetical protein
MITINLVAALLAIGGGQASAEAAESSHEVLIAERTVNLNVDISTTKLKLSRADYSSPVVKVLVPELADATILDHRNTGEGAPCMATYQALSPEEVIQNNPAVELVPMTITLKKILTPDQKNGRCLVTLDERIEGKIRGFLFEHQKTVEIGTRHLEDCR